MPVRLHVRPCFKNNVCACVFKHKTLSLYPNSLTNTPKNSPQENLAETTLVQGAQALP